MAIGPIGSSTSTFADGLENHPSIGLKADNVASYSPSVYKKSKELYSEIEKVMILTGPLQCLIVYFTVPCIVISGSGQSITQGGGWYPSGSVLFNVY